MPTKSQLKDLYVVGKEFTLEDGSHDPITIWIQKISEKESKQAVREANAARTAVTAIKRRPLDDARRDRFRVDFGDEDGTMRLIEVLVGQSLQQKRPSVEDEVAADDEFDEDSDYVQGLLDSWEGGLKDIHAKIGDTPEEDLDDEQQKARDVFAEMKRYNDEVEKRLEGHRETLMREYTKYLDKNQENEAGESIYNEGLLRVLQEKIQDKLIDLEATTAWLHAFDDWCLVFAVRDPETREYIFDGPDDLDELQPELLDFLKKSYQSILVGLTEGKGSSETQDS